MFIAGVKRLDRTRGSGWLECPNCHEQALQDVVDSMRFLTLGFYRFEPVSRTRFLICRRCGFKREAQQQPGTPGGAARGVAWVFALLTLLTFASAIFAAAEGTNSGLLLLVLAAGGCASAQVLARELSSLTVPVGLGAVVATAGLNLLSLFVLGDNTTWAVVHLADVGVALLAAALLLQPGARRAFQASGATSEMGKLNTAGVRIGHAWTVPIGTSAAAVVIGLLIGALVAGSAVANVPGVTFVGTSGISGDQKVIPATYDAPQGWNSEFDAKPDDPQPLRVQYSTTGTGALRFIIYRITDQTTLGGLVSTYYREPYGLQDQGFPTKPPTSFDCAAVDSVKAVRISLDYKVSGAKAQSILYFFFHQNVGYLFEFDATQADPIDTMQKIAKHVMATVKFTGNEPTPSPSPTVAGASPSAAGSPVASPAAGTPSPSPTGTPGPSYSC